MACRHHSKPSKGLASRGVLMLGIALIALPALAQDTGGVLLRLGVSQDLRHETNPDLDPDGDDPRTTARTSLSLDLSSTTDVDALSLSASGAIVRPQPDNAERLIQDPSVRLSYGRTGVNAAFDASLFLREREVSGLDFDLEVTDTGEFVAVSSVDTGVRRQTGGSVSLELGRNARFGTTLSYSTRDTRYINTSSPSLDDSSRDTASVRLRFDLSEVTRLSTTFSHSRLDTEGEDLSETTSANFSLVNERPDGDVTISGGLTRTSDGTRTRLSFGRALERPNATLSARLGLTRQVSGDLSATGTFNWSSELPRGQISLGLSQAVRQNTDDNETRLSSASLNYLHDLTPRLRGDFGVTWRNSETGDVTVESASVSAGLSYELSADWRLGARAQYRTRDEDGIGAADSTLFSLSLSREFEFRP